MKQAALLVAVLISLTATAAFKTDTTHLSWTPHGEHCVIYDYRNMIRNGDSTADFFAVEAMNANGGDFLGSYPIAKFPNAKIAYQTMMADMVKFSERCDSVQTFSPSAQNPDAPM